MSRSRVVAIAVLLGAIALLFFALKSGGQPGSPIGDKPVAAEPTSESKSVPFAVGSPITDTEATRAVVDSAVRTAVPARTMLSGRFVAPIGSWPGGGTARLALFGEPLEGGMMGMFSAGMEIAKRGGNAADDPDRKDIENRMKAWMGHAEPVAETPIGPDGRFEFRDPPAGRWVVRLGHQSLRSSSDERIDLAEGEHRDVGDLPTEVAASILVVASDQDGRPVEDARVMLTRKVDPAAFTNPSALKDFDGLIRQVFPLEGETDRNGRCAFDGLDSTDTWNLSVDTPGLVDAFREVRLVSGRETIVRVELIAGASLDVTVHDADGTPHPDAHVSLRYTDLTRPTVVAMQMGGGGGRGSQPLTFRMSTTADGSAHQLGLPSGLAKLELVTPGYRRETLDLTIPSEGSLTHSFVLDRGASVSGVVLDDSGDPIEGAFVLHMAALGQSVMGMDLDSIVGLDVLTVGADDRGVATDADGRFVLGGLEAGTEANLAAVAMDHDPARVDTMVGDEHVEFRLAAACNLHGRVLDDATGLPITSFKVELQQRKFIVVDIAVVTRNITNRADGTFDVAPVPRQVFTLSISADGYAAETRSVDLTAGAVDCGEVRLKLPAAIEGVVLDPDGAPLAGAKVRTSKGGPADSLMFAQMLGVRSIESDAQGHFRIDGLTGRAVRLLADHPRFAPFRSAALRIESGVTLEGIVLQVTRGGSVRGTIVDADHHPLPRWNVQAQNSTGSNFDFVQTDEDGKFHIDGMASGTYRVTGMPADYMQRSQWNPTDPSDLGSFDVSKMIAEVVKLTVEERVVVRDGEESEVTLVYEGATDGGEQLVSVEGAIRVGGTPLSSGMVALVPAGSNMQRHMGNVAAGEFQIAGVRPGTYRLQVRAGLLTGDLGAARVIVVPSSRSHRVDIELPGGGLSGRVIDPDTHEPVAGILLTLSRPGSTNASERMDVGEGAAMTDASGTFRFDGLEPGTYDIFAKQWNLGSTAGGRSARLGGIAVGSDEQRANLEIALARGGSLRVHVVDAGGPRANALVVLLGPHGDALDLFQRALTDRDGNAEFSDVPEGAYRASVDAPGAAPIVSSNATVRPGAESVLEVRVSPGVAVALQLTGEIPDRSRGELLVYSVWRDDGALLRSGRVTVPTTAAAEAAARAGLSLGTYTPGTYRLRVEGARFGVIDTTRTVPAGKPIEWTIDASELRTR